jgi:hypothetical protein
MKFVGLFLVFQVGFCFAQTVKDIDCSNDMTIAKMENIGESNNSARVKFSIAGTDEVVDFSLSSDMGEEGVQIEQSEEGENISLLSPVLTEDYDYAGFEILFSKKDYEARKKDVQGTIIVNRVDGSKPGKVTRCKVNYR